jgi:hypothetical protein
MFLLQSSMPFKDCTICAGARVLSSWKSFRYWYNQESSILEAWYVAFACTLSFILPRLYLSRSESALKYFSWGLWFASSGDKPACSVRKIFWKLFARFDTQSWSASLPTAADGGEGEVFPPIPLDDAPPRGNIVGELMVASPRPSCTGGGCEAFPPSPTILGFMPLINRSVSIQVW